MVSPSEAAVLDLAPARALFQGQVNAMAVAIYENERPFMGLSGILDWHFQGAISKMALAGQITGKLGECVYLPVTKQKTTYHLILVGTGKSAQAGLREPVPTEALRILKKNLSSLRLPKIGVSRSDFGTVPQKSDESWDYFLSLMKGIPVWILQ